MTPHSQHLNMLLLLLLTILLPAVRPESAERTPFYGFLPAYKIRALSPLGDGHPNDVYYDALPNPAPIPDGYEIRYPSYKFAFDVPQDPEEAAYIVTEKGAPSGRVKDCHHHHGKHGHGKQHEEHDGHHGHHHGDGHGGKAGAARVKPNAAATTAKYIHGTVLPPSHATVLPSTQPTAAAVYGRTTPPTGFSTAQSGGYTRPTVPTTAAAPKPTTTQPAGYFRPPNPPPRINHLPHGRPSFGHPRPGFRPSRPAFGHHSPPFRPPRPSFTPPRGKFAPPRSRQSTRAAAPLVPGHTATPPPSRFGNLKLSRDKFPAEQYRVFPGGYARLSTYSKLSG